MSDVTLITEISNNAFGWKHATCAHIYMYIWFFSIKHSTNRFSKTSHTTTQIFKNFWEVYIYVHVTENKN